MRRFQQLLSEIKASIEMIEENATAREETESSRDAERSHAEGSPRDKTGSLNSWKPDEKRDFSLRKGCNGWLARGTISFC